MLPSTLYCSFIVLDLFIVWWCAFDTSNKHYLLTYLLISFGEELFRVSVCDGRGAIGGYPFFLHKMQLSGHSPFMKAISYPKSSKTWIILLTHKHKQTWIHYLLGESSDACLSVVDMAHSVGDLRHSSHPVSVANVAQLGVPSQPTLANSLSALGLG